MTTCQIYHQDNDMLDVVKNRPDLRKTKREYFHAFDNET